MNMVKQSVTFFICTTLLLGISATASAQDKKSSLSPDEAVAQQAYALGRAGLHLGLPDGGDAEKPRCDD